MNLFFSIYINGCLKKIDTDLVQLAKNSQYYAKCCAIVQQGWHQPFIYLLSVCENWWWIMPSNMEKEIRCPSIEGTVSNSKRILLWDKLIILKFSSSISNTLLSYELMHSLTSDVIENIVAKSFSPHDISATMPIFVI